VLALRIDAERALAPVVSFELRCHTVAPRRIPQRLFGQATVEAERIDKAAARVAELFDDLSYSRIGSPRLLDSHRSGAFELVRFPAPASRDVHTETQRTQTQALRVFRPPLAVKLDAGGAVPALHEVTTLQGKSASINGSRLEVIACSGPWRTSGEWWQESRWSWDEWDVELSDGSLCRLVHDMAEDKWYVRGRWD
jgi:hypothetical protein